MDLFHSARWRSRRRRRRKCRSRWEETSFEPRAFSYEQERGPPKGGPMCFCADLSYSEVLRRRRGYARRFAPCCSPDSGVARPLTHKLAGAARSAAGPVCPKTLKGRFPFDSRGYPGGILPGLARRNDNVKNPHPSQRRAWMGHPALLILPRSGMAKTTSKIPTQAKRGLGWGTLFRQ